ncbi:unnamed protein product [Musa acuminata subsp. malaccensis]|uniref:(wild Malaysian banana) hypothetical protein n=1 Tax=Musa acuminata subsp. malaccensis TaxID=214687 RepID=A0A804HR80_MUSAM|nr:PREDICTED: titin homolog [Musa acuminata subsp. malaccensis]CAG1858797.1 unnamed protein product [Musa acuminata subsp. malaccensis]
MPRSSRHRSHRSHKHSRDRSDSEEDENPRERRTTEEELAASLGARISRDPQSEKRRSSHEHAAKELVDTGNGDTSGEKKRKSREEEEVMAADRWNGGAENDHKRTKAEEFGPVELDKYSRSKAADSKGRSSSRHEDSNERDECGGKNESVKGKSDKDSSRRGSTVQYKDGKERDTDKDREAQDSRHHKSDDLGGIKPGSQAVADTEDIAKKKYTKINERLHSAEAEKGLEKHMKRDDSEDKDKWLDESRDFDEKRQSSRDDLSKNRSYRDEKHAGAKYRGKYRDEDDKDRKHRDDKYQDECISKDHTNDKSDKGHLRDENKHLESHYKKSKLQDTDHDGNSYVDDHDTRPKDSKGRKRYSDEKEDHGNLNPRGAKERREVVDKNASTSRTVSRSDKPRSERQHAEKADSSPRYNRLKTSTSSSAYAAKDHNRDVSKVAESAHRESAPEERLRPVRASKGDSLTSSGLRDRSSGTRSGKLTQKDDVESAASKFDKTLKPDHRASPNHSKGRSSSANSGRRFSERSPSKYDRTTRQRLDIEIGQRSSSSKYGDRGESVFDKPILDDMAQTDVCARESTPVGSSSINRSGYLSDRSPNHLHPPPPMRLQIDSPSVLGPYQDDNKAQSSDHKSYNRYKRIGDLGFERGHGNAWKGAPSWPSPVTNGFMPLHHGPPTAGFPPPMSQFSAPPLFGIRPSMDMTHGGVSYHMHDMAERFSGHGQPFGWHNPVDQICHPHMQMWDRSNVMFNNEFHIYARQEWDDNNQLMGSRGWETGSETCKGENSNNMDTPVPKKEQESTTHSPTDELAQLKCSPKPSNDTLATKSAVEFPQKAISKKTPEPLNMQGDKIANYLSRIDISPDLAGLDLYKRCTSLLGMSDVNCAGSLTAYRFIQSNKDDILVKKSMGSVSNSFFPTAKEVIFKRAMSLYQKQNERVNGKHALSAPVYSEEKQKEPPEASDNKKTHGCADHHCSLEKPPVDDADAANNMKAGNSSIAQDSDCPPTVKVQKSDPVSDLAVVYCNGLEASEDLIEECGASPSLAPNSVENTH